MYGASVPVSLHAGWNQGQVCREDEADGYKWWKVQGENLLEKINILLKLSASTAKRKLFYRWIYLEKVPKCAISFSCVAGKTVFPVPHSPVLTRLKFP